MTLFQKRRNYEYFHRLLKKKASAGNKLFTGDVSFVDLYSVIYDKKEIF